MLKRLFSTSRPDPAARAPKGNRAYAIGDIHGRLDLLEHLLERIEADCAGRPAAANWIVFLGDLIDRGPDSKGVIDRLIRQPPAFARSVFVKGNHEEIFRSILGGDERGLRDWLAYGGRECAQSYGLSLGWLLNANPAAIMERLIAEVPASHLRFIDEMADSFRFGDYLFVHAGIRPGVPLEQQSSRDLRWIREGFLEDRSDHGVTVVHGHTIVERAEEHPNRIALDTGAYRSGTLTAVGLEDSSRWFIEARQDSEAPLPPR